MEVKAVRLQDDFLDNIKGGVGNGMIPMTDDTCPKCGCGKAWTRPEQDSRIMHTCPRCGHVWYE